MNLTLKPYEINIHDEYYPDQPVREAYVKVNLMATDDQLKQDFNDWLKNYRKLADSNVIESKNQKAKKVKHVFDSVDFKKWIEFQVIPFIDLRMIALFEEKSIVKADVAKILFFDPNPDNRSKKLNTTINIADYFLKNSAHETLKAQLLMEKISEKNTDKSCYQ